MNKLIIRQIVIDQKGELDNLYKRNRMKERSAPGLLSETSRWRIIKVITGIRRCGKSVFAYHYLEIRICIPDFE
jgi:predicted AAA+ superfamily ATPase